MIIGNNKNNNSDMFKPTKPQFTSNFEERYNTVVEEGSKNQGIVSPFSDKNETMKYSNVNSKSEMADKSFAMLQERYNNGLISLDEFTKKCNQLNKMRQK